MKQFLEFIMSILKQLFAQSIPVTPALTVTVPIPSTPAVDTIAPKYLWDTPINAKHSVRVICDEEGLSVNDKNLICAVIEAESGFYNTAKNLNKRSDGTVSSTDFGICQINDRYHIGVGKDFPSVDYVLNNPDQAVRWMIKMYKAGLITMWCAYTNGSYKRFLI